MITPDINVQELRLQLFKTVTSPNSTKMKHNILLLDSQKTANH